FGQQVSDLAVWLLALFPASVVFSMVYPSAMFLAATAWAFVFLDERRDLAAGLCAALAALTRPNGIVLAAALAVAVGVTARRLRVVCGPAVLALGAWMAYNLASTGDALEFFDAKHAWHEVTVVHFLANPRLWQAIHLALAALAVGAVLVARRQL